MPRRQKSMQTVFVESVLFVSLFALVGHISINFWERYTIQNELIKMKTSLHSMRDTVKSIGMAYDNLHDDLVELVQLADQKPNTLELRKEQDDKPRTQERSTSDRKIVNDLEVQVMGLDKTAQREQKISASPSMINATTQRFLQEHRMCKNATTIANCRCLDRRQIKHNMHTSKPSLDHKITQNFESKINPSSSVKNATTAARYTAKSTGVEDMSKSEEMSRYEDSPINSCNEDTCKICKDFLRF